MSQLPDFLCSRAKSSGVADAEFAELAGGGEPHRLGALALGAIGLVCAYLGWVAWFGFKQCLALRSFRLIGNRHPEEARSLLLAAIGLGLAQLLFASLAMGLGWVAEQRAAPQRGDEWLGVLAFRLGGVLLALLSFTILTGG